MNSTSPLSPDLRLYGPGAPRLLSWWLAYLAFVVYGSLVPLDYRPIPWEQAWSMFQHIRMLNVGAGGRADWVANGVLYFPVGFLTASLLSGQGRAARLAVVLGALACVAALALGVEFAQLFFPPRTVSLNDLVAEFIGGGAGAALAVVAADRLRRLLAAWVEGMERFAPRLLKLYALAYCAFSFFPFDFLMSSGELWEKLASESWGWLWAGIGRPGRGVAWAAKVAAEALAAFPLGWLLASQGWTRGRVLAGGGVLGVVIEIGQFFLVSGVAQGFSVLTRAVGALAGAVAWDQRGRLDPLVLAGVLRRHGLMLLVLYLLALLGVTGWFELPWRGWGEASLVLGEVRFLPFYYHYYTTEQAALLSLTSVCLLYAPLGVLAWAYFLGPWLAGCLAALLAAVVEGSKLFLAGQHPDPTNLLLAFAAGWLGCRLGQGAEGLARRVGTQVSAGAVTEGAPDLAPSSPSRRTVGEAGGAVRSSAEGADPAWRRPGALGLGALVAAGGLAAWGALSFPLYPALLGLALTGYGVAVWYRPYWLWAAVPAALGLLDLAPWSGRFFADEFDLLLLVSVAVGYVRLGPAPAVRRNGLWHLLVGLVVLAYGISTLRGLLPWQGLDANTFSHYYSPFNALRIAKGAAWALLLAVLARRFSAAGVDVVRHFGLGLVLGLAGTVAVVIWERWAFPGLFNFTDVYRVTGPFSQMNTGGADLDSYLTVAAPFLVWGLFERRGWMERSLGIVLLVATTYAVMVSFSRAAYAGFGLAVVVTAIFALRQTSRGRPWAWVKPGLAVAALGVLVLAVAAPVFMGGFAQARLARAGEDLAIRIAHWREALAMRDGGLATEVFGMGLGRYPATHYWRSEEARAASYQIGRDGDNPYLRLGTGSPLYVEQFVAVRPKQDYSLSLRARSQVGGARLSASLCEKWLLTSARCVFGGFEVPRGDWKELTIKLPAGEVGNEPWYRRRPVKLSLYNPSHEGVIEVDDVQLAGRDGQALLANGDFGQGMDRWFFTADVDLPWHIWSLPVGVLFAAGWLGCVAASLFVGLAVIRGLRNARLGQVAAMCCLGAVSGLAVISAVADIGDSPRILVLSLLTLCFLSGKY